MLPAKELPPVNFVQCTMHYFSSPCKLHQDIPRSDSKSIFSLTKIHPINLKPFWQRSNTESFISLEEMWLSTILCTCSSVADSPLTLNKLLGSCSKQEKEIDVILLALPQLPLSY